MTLKELRIQIEQEDEERDKAAAAKTQNAIECFEGLVKEWLGDVYEEFEWEYGFVTGYGSQAYVTIKRGILERTVSNSGFTIGDAGHIKLNHTRALVKWAEKADKATAKYAWKHDVGLKNATMLFTAGEIINYNRLCDIRRHAKKYGYVDDPAYVKARAVYRAMRQVRVKRRERKEAEEAAAKVKEFEEEAAAVQTWDDYRTWRSKFVHDVPTLYFSGVVGDVSRRLSLQDEGREDRAYKASLAAFNPFVYYTIKFTSVAMTEDREALCDHHAFNSLQIDPHADGFYLDVWGKRRRPVNVFEVVEMVVSEHSQLPQWCPLVEATEKCNSYRIPPTDAKRTSKKDVKRPPEEEDDDYIPF